MSPVSAMAGGENVVYMVCCNVCERHWMEHEHGREKTGRRHDDGAAVDLTRLF